jgi:hypothetical protein
LKTALAAFKPFLLLTGISDRRSLMLSEAFAGEQTTDLVMHYFRPQWQKMQSGFHTHARLRNDDAISPRTRNTFWSS